MIDTFFDNILTQCQLSVNSACQFYVNSVCQFVVKGGGPPSPLPGMYVSADGMPERVAKVLRPIAKKNLRLSIEKSPQNICQIKRLAHRMHNYYMKPYYKRDYVIGDLVTIAPEFRYDYDIHQRQYIGIVVETVGESNDYIVHWTSSPGTPSRRHDIDNGPQYRGLWSGSHLIKVEDYANSLSAQSRSGA